MNVASFSFSRFLMRASIFSFSVMDFLAARRSSGAAVATSSSNVAEMNFGVFMVEKSSMHEIIIKLRCVQAVVRQARRGTQPQATPRERHGIRSTQRLRRFPTLSLSILSSLRFLGRGDFNGDRTWC